MADTIDLKPNPKILEWARQRSGVSREAIIKKWSKYEQWLDGTKTPTVKQIRDFADKVHINVPDLYLDEIPNLELQIADFRTGSDKKVVTPSPELYDTINLMISRQQWMREYFIHEGREKISFVGSFTGKPLDNATKDELVNSIYALLNLNDAWATKEQDVRSALKTLKDAIERVGVSVEINGIVGNNTHRPLNEYEFRGFALSDDYAPLIFVNGKDNKTAQMFTLIHELCHLAFSETGVSNPLDDESVNSVSENFCNKVAADFLVPTKTLCNSWNSENSKNNYKKICALARKCKVNFIVVARKVKDEGLIDSSTFYKLYHTYKTNVPVEGKNEQKSGGNYYRNMQYKLGNVFGDAIWTAANTDFISFRDAYALSDMKGASFMKYFEGQAC